MLNGKNVFITGSNRGIGKSVVELFAQNGFNVYAHARAEDLEFLDFLSIVAKENKVKIIPICFDLNDIPLMKDKIKNLLKDKVSIDVLINSAGVAIGGYFQMTPISKIREIFDVNFFSHLELTQLILRGMVKQKSGSIINIGSTAGMDFPAGMTAYGVSKAALMSWTQILANEMGKLGIRVNAIAPTIVNTDMKDQNSSESQNDVLYRTALGRFAEPEEIAKVALFLASDESSFVTGQVIRVDGGM